GTTNNLQRQVGIGIVQGGSGVYQNYYVIDTGALYNSPAFLTGVVYSDANHNGQYDAGEGLGGGTVTVAGVGSVATVDTGGYSIAVPAGTYTVTTSGDNRVGPLTRQVSVGGDNVRLDLLPPANLRPAIAAAMAHSTEHYDQFVAAAYEKYLGRAAS